MWPHADDAEQTWGIVPGGEPKNVINPVEQARHDAHQVVDALSRDKQLVSGGGAHKGAPAFPWSYGAGFTRITRRQFEAAELRRAIESHRVACDGRSSRRCA